MKQRVEVPVLDKVVRERRLEDGDTWVETWQLCLELESQSTLCCALQIGLSIWFLWHMSYRRPLVVPSDVFDVGLGPSKDAWSAEALFLFLMQSWEFGIPLCRELACQYESLYDYQSLSWIRVSFALLPPQPWLQVPGLSWHQFLNECSL